MKTVDTMENGDKTSVEIRVLVATQNSEFKRTVVSEIRNTLGGKAFYIKVVDVKRLPDESIDQYSVIVILNRCMAGPTRGWKVLSTPFRIQTK